MDWGLVLFLMFWVWVRFSLAYCYHKKVYLPHKTISLSGLEGCLLCSGFQYFFARTIYSFLWKCYVRRCNKWGCTISRVYSEWGYWVGQVNSLWSQVPAENKYLWCPHNTSINTHRSGTPVVSSFFKAFQYVDSDAVSNVRLYWVSTFGRRPNK